MRSQDRRGLRVTALVLILAGASVPDVAAQVRAEGRAGPTFPVSGLADIADSGFGAGAGVVLALVPGFGLRFDAQGEWLNDRVDPLGVVPAPPLSRLFAGGGFEIDFAPPRDQAVPLSLRLRATGGMARVSGSAVYDDGSSVEISTWRPSVLAGLAIGVRPTGAVEIFADAGLHLTILPEEQTERFAGRSLQVDTFSNLLSFPVSLGLRISP